MSKITRRHLLGSAATGAGSLMGASLLGPALARAAAQGPRGGSIRDVRHVVIHMQENRSFDHYFGTLSGVRGFGDPNVAIQANGRSLFYQQDPQNPDGYLLPWHLDTQSTSSQAIPSTSHAWSVQHEALNITVPSTPGQPTTAANDSWLPAHLAADGDARGPYTMGYYERADIPFHFALAETFTVLDGYHCSLIGPTWPNRMYLMTGMIDPTGANGGPIISNVVPSPTTGEPYTWTTYPERLTAAGISWRVYQEEDDYGTNMLEFFEAFQCAKPGSALYEGGLTIHPPDRFEWDAKHNRLPTVSWIVPTSGQSEHPAYIPASGADYLASKLNAVAGNEDLWRSTVFIVNYDENDGLFDHVIPPLPPAGTPGEFVDGLPIGAGVRVPAFIVSPWTVGGYVATENFDHTSVLQFLETVTGVGEPNISAWRRQTFGDLTSALGFSGGSTQPPPLPDTIGGFWQAEQELATLPAAMVPGAAQTPPAQETSRPGSGRSAGSGGSVGPGQPPWRAQPADRHSGAARRAHTKTMPRPASRLEENRTTHAADFAGGTDKVLLARIAEVSGRAVNASSGDVLAYVPGIVGGSVAIITATNVTLASAITSGTTNPYGVAATPDGSQVWVTESGTNTVSVWATATNTLLTTITVGVYPHGVAISPDGSTAYVANTGPNTGPGGSQTVSVIDVPSHTVTGTVSAGEAPQTIAVAPNGSAVYVACADGVYGFTPGSDSAQRAPVTLHHPHGVSVSPDSNCVWVTDSARDRVVILAAGSLAPVAAVPTGHTPWNVAFSADGSTAYVSNVNDDTVSVIDTVQRTGVTTIALGAFSTANKVTGAAGTQLHHQPSAVATAPDGSIWVANNSSSSLAVIDPGTNTVVSSLELGLADDPTGIAFVTVT